jgi:hypothetical protein
MVTYLIYASIISLHIGLSGAKYLSYTFFIERGERPIYKWNVHSAYWDFFMFFADMTIAIAITLYIIRKDAHYSQMPMIDSFVRMANDKRFVSFSYIQLMTIVLYYLVYYMKVYTRLLQNDRNFLAIDGINAFFFSIHAAVTIYSSEYYVIVLENVKKSRVKRRLKVDKSVSGTVATERLSFSS